MYSESVSINLSVRAVYFYLWLYYKCQYDILKDKVSLWDCTAIFHVKGDSSIRK